MGAWGIKALESDEGLDVVDVLREYLEGFKNKKVITLKEIINLMIEEGLLGETFEEIEFLYDNTAIAISELYFYFKENGKLDYYDEDGESELVDVCNVDGQNPSFEEWYNHLGSWIEKLKAEYGS